MSREVCSQARSSVRSTNALSQPDRTAFSTAARNSESTRSQPSQRARRTTAADLTRLLDADAVDLRDVGDAIRVHPELEATVLKLCEFLALLPGIPVATVEEAAIVLGKDRLRVVVHAWSVSQWSGDARCRSQAGIAADIPDYAVRSQTNEAAPAAIAAERRKHFLSSEFSAEILHLAQLFHWTRGDAVSFANNAGEDYTHRLDLELKHAAHLTNLLVRDLLSLVSLVEPADLSPEQEALLEEILQVRS